MVLGIYGAGGAGREVYDMIRSEKPLSDRWAEIVFIDDSVENGELYTLKKLPFSSFAEKYKPGAAEIVIAVGEPAIRKMLAARVKQQGYDLAVVVSTHAAVSPTVHFGEGAGVAPYAIIGADTKIGSNVWVGWYCHLGHDINVAENCQISSWSKFGGGTTIEENVFVGMDACIRENIVIGHDAVISMGAIVLRDVRPNKVVMGNPAREIAENTDHRVFGGNKHGT